MERRRAFEAVRAFLRGLAERSPVLFLVDDLQYAGQSTVELMHFLGRERPGTRMLVVTAVRAENDAQADAALAPVARSTLLCVPNALSQRGGYALGAQAGEAAVRQVVTDAGFTRFRRAAETRSTWSTRSVPEDASRVPS